MTLQFKFVDFIPDVINQGVIYISLKYKTAIHKCACGCKNEVVTPFSPTDWQLTFDGESISLKPSIGNWNFECRSHYLLVRNEIIHVKKWTESQIDSGRKKDKSRKKWFFSKKRKNENDTDHS